MKFILLPALLLFSENIYSQTFTKITSGDFVNDGGESFGAAWADFNNDGFADLFVSNGGAASVDAANFLYMNNGDATFTKVREGDIVKQMSKSIGSTVADINNDGFEDIFIANRDGQNNCLFINEGGLSFRKIADGNVVQDGGNSNGSAFTDYDKDGKIDIFVANFFTENYLYRNIGELQFESTPGVGPVKVISTSISASWSDFNNDGYTDVIIANAASAGRVNDLFLNNGDGMFTTISDGPVSSDKKASMGASWGDYNNDGYLDLFIANQANFTNDLYTNNGDGSFTKMTGEDIVNAKSYSISGSWVDVNNDGNLDLFVTNWLNNENFLFINDGPPGYTFIKIREGDIVNDQYSSMGASWSDYDNDGDLDLFVANRDGMNNNFYRNDFTGNNWFSIKCIGTKTNKSAIGTKIKIKSSIGGIDTWQLREINTQHGYNSQNDSRVHFGIGDATIIDSLIIMWHSNEMQVFENIDVNKFYKILEGEELSVITSVNENISRIPTSFALSQNYPNPFNPYTLIKYSVLSESQVELKVYDVTGKEITTLVNEIKPVGTYTIRFNPVHLASGTYIYRLTSNSKTQAKKLIVLK